MGYMHFFFQMSMILFQVNYLGEIYKDLPLGFLQGGKYTGVQLTFATLLCPCYPLQQKQATYVPR